MVLFWVAFWSKRRKSHKSLFSFLCLGGWQLRPSVSEAATACSDMKEELEKLAKNRQVIFWFLICRLREIACEPSIPSMTYQCLDLRIPVLFLTPNLTAAEFHANPCIAYSSNQNWNSKWDWKLLQSGGAHFVRGVLQGKCVKPSAVFTSGRHVLNSTPLT